MTNPTRSPSEITNRISQIKMRDFFGFQTGDLLDFLPFDQAKQFLKPEATAEDWAKVYKGEPTRETLKQVILDYMPFAWEKANNNRGLSAGRSINHMQAWLWLYGVDEQQVDSLGHYDLYGKPQLRAICEAFGWDWRKWDDERWTNDEMDDGYPPPEVNSVVLTLPA